MKSTLLDKRHKKADEEIKKISSEVFKANKGKILEIAKQISSSTGRTMQTILNYCKMGGKDGFLKEEIIKQLKIYK